VVLLVYSRALGVHGIARLTDFKSTFWILQINSSNIKKIVLESEETTSILKLEIDKKCNYFFLRCKAVLIFLRSLDFGDNFIF